MAANDEPCCSATFWVYLLTCIAVVVFSGLVSGLTIGLFSLNLVDLEVLSKAGQSEDRQNAAKILPVVKNQHLLLCTLIIVNSLATEALPIFLDALAPAWVAILVSVTLILAFGEILPQAVCSRYGLKIGAKMAFLVRLLVLLFFPISYPISKLLDWLLGTGHFALMRRAELKTLVYMHGNEAGKGGELSHHETAIISGALDLTQKTAYNAMTPISEAFSLDLNSKLDMHTRGLIRTKGHSRVPIYSGNPTNIIGIILVKNLITCCPKEEIPVRNVAIRKIPRVPDYLPLYDILNEFQKGHSHMAVVVKHMKGTEENVGNMKGNVSMFEKMHQNRRHTQGEKQGDSPSPVLGEVLNISIEKSSSSRHPEATAVHSQMSKSNTEDGDMPQHFKKWERQVDDNVLDVDVDSLPSYPSDEKVIGIITMEDVMEELLQGEILDETDEYVDVYHKIRINMETLRRSSPRSARVTPSASPFNPYHPSILRSPLSPYIYVPVLMPTLSSSPKISLPGTPEQHHLSRSSPASHRMSILT